MSKIRLIPPNKEDKDVFEVYAPGKNSEYPIGRIWFDVLKNKWLLRPYFIPLTRDELKKDRFEENREIYLEEKKIIGKDIAELRKSSCSFSTLSLDSSIF